MKHVDDKLPLDGSEKMTGNLTIEKNGEAKIIFNGSMNNAHQGFSSLEFKNNSGVDNKSYMVLMGHTKGSRRFRFT